jgi:hypothetical protein
MSLSLFIPITNEYVFVGAEQGFVHYNPLKTEIL